MWDWSTTLAAFYAWNISPAFFSSIIWTRTDDIKVTFTLRRSAWCVSVVWRCHYCSRELTRRVSNTNDISTVYSFTSTCHTFSRCSTMCGDLGDSKHHWTTDSAPDQCRILNFIMGADGRGMNFTWKSGLWCILGLLFTFMQKLQGQVNGGRPLPYLLDPPLSARNYCPPPPPKIFSRLPNRRSLATWWLIKSVKYRPGHLKPVYRSSRLDGLITGILKRTLNVFIDWPIDINHVFVCVTFSVHTLSAVTSRCYTATRRPRSRTP